MQPPRFTFEDVKYTDDSATFERAEALYRKGSVKNIHEIGFGRNIGYRAVVQSTQPYEVEINSRHVDQGDCTCYMGQHDMLCKHMLALALAVLDATVGLTSPPPATDLLEAQQRVNEGMAKLRAYTGPSKVWFSYQRTLATGVGIIADAVSELPPSKENADYLWKLVLRLSKKLATGGIDDSDGVVGDCIRTLVEQLGTYAKEKPELKPIITRYCQDDTGFGFEEDLREVVLGPS
ncbi:MAG: hypothetical protein A2940_02080 [Candidatus Wildermuthbacteria bacterium RIFCSPLOWO2_01_FULL_48_29]|uniref:SWIM-type domain-containing protein n=2 Tax=Candidatus Wildermuthiibacteriota TaxID=1817923 RepID=A0A1G2RMI4_9BACT|nr:MAG: hypothetical protein A2843_02430 [Candidatus Wildermuthbacteria bacterium RIFCSPHIGHO2_01_FULL_48_27b]OHA74063.1 MAG: hypothetical protein A2940_02080 [Candidatus Wildermuthbacteria bacterium RIFCSPLOWO2_01_FULL_48_29]